jgi:hypothetical protein
MNDELHLTDEQLRLATTRSLPPDAALDADAAAARETFIALGAGLEDAGGRFSESELVTRLQHSCLAGQVTANAVVRRKPTHFDWWAFVVSGALAAAAIFAIARIVFDARQTDHAVAAAAVPGGDLAADDELRPGALTAGWSDPLDDEIAFAAATIDGLGARRPGFDGSLIDMNERLEALSYELLGESL